MAGGVKEWIVGGVSTVDHGVSNLETVGGSVGLGGGPVECIVGPVEVSGGSGEGKGGGLSREEGVRGVLGGLTSSPMPATSM